MRAPVCELAVGALWAATGCLWGAGQLPSAWLPALLGLGWLGVAAGVVDVRHRRLPDALTAPAACLAPLGLLPLGAGAVGRGLLGALVAVVGYGAGAPAAARRARPGRRQARRPPRRGARCGVLGRARDRAPSSRPC